MSKSRVDKRHRIELPGSQPGDVFEVQKQADGGYVLVRLQGQPAGRPKTKEGVLQAMEENPLKLTMSWEVLRQITREP